MQTKTNTRLYVDVLNKRKNIEKTREEGARVRARFTEINKFNRPTKEFYKYEKQIQAKGSINALIDKTGKEIYTKEEIMGEIQEYYQTLYKKETSSNVEIQKNCDILKNKAIEKEEAEKLGSLITEKEIKTALKQMKNEKSPGSDGLTKEFYIIFWNDLKDILEEMLNNIYLANSLSESQKEGVIKLLYKKGNTKELKNWRPISLLNIDYKILTKILANRVKEVLPKIIDQDQACGIKGRSIHDHLEILTSLTEITNDKTVPRPGIAFLAVNQDCTRLRRKIHQMGKNSLSQHT